MKKVEGWKAGLFIGSLSVIAIVILMREDNRPTLSPSRVNVPTSGQSSPGETPIDEAKARDQKLALAKIAAEEKAAAHARFLTRNVNPGFTKEPHPTFAIVTATSDGKLNFQMTSSLIRRLATNDLRLIPSFFTPEFVSDGNFKVLADGSNELISNLELPRVLDGLVLAREEVNFDKTPSLENLVTATLELQVSIIRFAEHNDRQTFAWSANGPGFKETDARLAAEERIMKEIARDTNFSLIPTHTNR